jgi:hypothetical protein
MAMLRRLLAWFLPGKVKVCSFTQKLYSMFLPDRRHIHHRLLDSGFTHRGAVLVLYFVSTVMGIAAVLITSGSLNSSLILGGLVILIILAARKLGYNEMSVIRNGILLKLYSFTFLKNSVLQICIDALSIFTAFCLAYIFTLPGTLAEIFGTGILFTAITIVIIQLSVFVFGGLYKCKTALLGLGDFLQILKVVLAAVLITAFLQYFMPVSSKVSQINIVMLDFYFLITLVAGSRILFHALNYVFKRQKTDGKKALIYGADWKGMIVLQALLQSENNEKIPVGFLDDDPELEGKYMNGYQIYGGHWKLEGLVKKGLIDEIIMSGEKTGYEIFKRIISIAQKYSVPIQVSKINFEALNTNHQKNKSKKYLIKEDRDLTPKIV